MEGPVRDLAGNTLQRHDCAARSELARKMVIIAKLVRGPWQFCGSEKHLSIAIRYCPFCGVELAS